MIISDIWPFLCPGYQSGKPTRVSRIRTPRLGVTGLRTRGVPRVYTRVNFLILNISLQVDGLTFSRVYRHRLTVSTQIWTQILFPLAHVVSLTKASMLLFFQSFRVLTMFGDRIFDYCPQSGMVVFTG